MAEVVGGAILTAIIQVLVESFASPEVANFFRNNRHLRKKLEVKLLSANKLLNDAEDKQVKDEYIKKWVDELNEVLNEANNVIDEINTKALCLKVEGEALRKKIIKLPTSFNPFKRGIKNKLEEIIESLEELEKFLGGKKFFLVLDDVWNEKYTLWNSLKSYFQVGGDGSKIIMTTRSEQIGSKMGSVPYHSLTPMEDDDCWKLFQKHAFRSVQDCTKQLETIGKEIARKCKGLPLAIVSLAGLLRSVSDSKEWEKVLKSDVWEQERKGEVEILPSLWFSYSYLPSNVKRCFAYCSIFPKDYEFEKENIMLLWMAEGLVQGENMEDRGEEYFKTLVSRSLLQRSAEDESSFVMHDLVHDLATFVSGKGFCMRLGEGDGLEFLSSKTRHLLCYSRLDDPKGLSRANNLRTFIINSDMSDRVSQEFPKKFGCLRVLCLSYYWIDKVPDSIGKLKHLRYLDLSGTSIERLPDTICSLYNLQTLLLRQCHRLSHLPAKMEKLINLRHLDISKTNSLKEIPLSVYNLRALQTINKFMVGSGSRIRELIKFPHLRGYLEVFGIENIVDVEDAAGFEEKSLVTELILCWGTNDWFRESKDEAKDRAILDALQPHPNLKKLRIDKYGGKEFSDWVASFSNVTEVSLDDCKHCSQLPPFGQLPSLQKLQVKGLHSVETIGSEFYGSSGAAPFPCLKILEIEDMDKLQSWSFEAEGAFPCLEELTIEVCRMLKTISLDSIHCLPSLKELSICDCPKLEFSGLPLPSSLKQLYISNCDMVYAQRMEWGLKALTEMRIVQCNNADSFPEEGLLPTTLTDLKIQNIRNLKSLNGKAFQHLTSLKTLEITLCPNLQSLPEEGLPASLKWLEVYQCPILEVRSKRETGEDWHKISHIPIINLN